MNPVRRQELDRIYREAVVAQEAGLRAEPLYAADYTLEEWLYLRRGWCNERGDTAHWLRAQNSALGPANLRTGVEK